MENEQQCATMNSETTTRSSEDSLVVSPESVTNIIPFPGQEKESEIATEGGHWYLPDGTPFYTVPRASNSKGGKKGEPRPVSLRFDRKTLYAKGAVPSVTTVAKLLDKPGLNHYFERHIFDATIEWLRNASTDQRNLILNCGDVLDSVFKDIKTASREHARRRANEGSKLHGEIEYFLTNHRVRNPEYRKHIFELVRAVSQLGIDLSGGNAEHSFAHPMGFGGKVDFHKFGHNGCACEVPDSGFVGQCGQCGTPWSEAPVLLDFKTKDKIEADKEYGYDEHPMQLVAYREGLGLPENTRCINIFVGVDDCKILPLEWNKSDLKRGWRMFELVLSLWKIKNNYYPKKGNNE